MKCIYTSADTAEVGLLKNMMQKAGIPCVEKNEQLAQVLPITPFTAELWVEHDADYPTAAALLAEWQHPTPATGAPWVCSRCGERMSAQFKKCWKCGTHQNVRQ
jgi:hypothetical protein